MRVIGRRDPIQARRVDAIHWVVRGVGETAAHRIVTQEPPRHRIIIALAQVVVAGLRVLLLAREAPVVAGRTRLRADGPESVVGVGGDDVAVRVRDVGYGAEAACKITGDRFRALSSFGVFLNEKLKW